MSWDWSGDAHVVTWGLHPHYCTADLLSLVLVSEGQNYLDAKETLENLQFDSAQALTFNESDSSSRTPDLKVPGRTRDPTNQSRPCPQPAASQGVPAD